MIRALALFSLCLVLPGCAQLLVATTGLSAGIALVQHGAEATGAVLDVVETALDIRERIRAKPPHADPKLAGKGDTLPAEQPANESLKTSLKAV